MRLVADSASLVVAGIWNPAILNPHWLVHQAMGVPEGQAVNVQMEQALMGPPQATTYVIEGVKFAPARNRLILRPTQNSAANFAHTQKTATNILRMLPHTPVMAVGQNFEFLEDAPSADQLAAFNAVSDLAERCEFEFETVGTQLVSSIRFNGRLLNFTRVHTGGNLQLRFNFHYETLSAEAAAQAMADENLFWQNLEVCLQMIRQLYRVDVNVGDVEAPQPQAAPA
jgi:hypothetical protein